MRTGRRWQAGLVCVVLMALLTQAVWALDFPVSGTLPDGIVYDPVEDVYTVNVFLSDTDWDVLIQDATVNLETGSGLDFANTMTAINGSIVNVNDCTFAQYSALSASDDSEVNIYNASFELGAKLIVTAPGTNALYNANVTFYGTKFEVIETGVFFDDPSVVSISGSDLHGNTLKVYYTDVDYFDVPVSIPYQMSVNLVWLGGPPEPEVIDVVIDIKPDSADNTVNLGSKGVIPVAILSNDSFDAPSLVNADSLFLGGAQVAVRGKNDKLMSHAEDINGDGYVDLICQFDSDNFAPDVVQEGPVYMEGRLNDGTLIAGDDWIVVVPQ